jgi:uncharacterized membrane protein
MGPGCSGRVLTVDALRGLAIVLMLFQHTPQCFLRDVSDSNLYAIAYLVSRLSAPLFLLLVGYCVYMSGSKRTAIEGRAGFLRHIVRRSLTLVVVGYFVNLTVLGDLFAINVIHLIAASVLASGLLYLSGSRRAYILILGLLVGYSIMGPVVKTGVNPDSPAGFFVWLMTEGEYPIASWIVYSIIGLGVGLYLGVVRQSMSRLILIGQFTMLAGLVTLLFGFSMGVRGNSIPFMVIILGGQVIVISTMVFLEGKRETVFIPRFLAVYGRYSLAIYVIHHLFFITVPKLTGFSNVFDMGQVAFLFAFFLGLAWIVLRKLESGR